MNLYEYEAMTAPFTVAMAILKSAISGAISKRSIVKRIVAFHAHPWRYNEFQMLSLQLDIYFVSALCSSYLKISL